LLVAVPAIHRGMGQTTAQVQQMIQQKAANYPNVPGLSTVALAVASHESAFQPTAQNPTSSACGLFQLLSVTQSSLGVSDCTDASQNSNAGVSLLAQYYQTYGNWNQALQAFSDGPGTVQQGLPPSPQTLGLISYVNSYSPPAGSDMVDLSNLASSAPSGSGSDNPVSDALGISQYGVTDSGLAITAAAIAGLFALSFVMKPSPAYA